MAQGRGLGGLFGWAVAAAALGGACANGTSGSLDQADAAPNLVGDGGGPCTNLQCSQVDCAAKGLPETTVSGIAYDPAGHMPLYNVFVYVPNATPDPIVAGSPTCSACQAPASGSPLVYTSTDSAGAFHLKNVPAGDHVPIVLQLGKWRRQLEIPHVEACTDNAFRDPNVVRLPAKASEGDMPLMALASGCDAAECFLHDLGIDASEFTGPGGSGHVHVYGGNYAGVTIPGMGDAYSLWSSASNLLKYDMVLGACECYVYPRDTQGPAYDAMKAFLDGGGRFYSTHYHFNWFAPPTGPPDFQSVADWGDDYASLGFASFFVDTTLPQGQGVRRLAREQWPDDDLRKHRPHRHPRQRGRGDGGHALDLRRDRSDVRPVHVEVPDLQHAHVDAGSQPVRPRHVLRRAPVRPVGRAGRRSPPSATRAPGRTRSTSRRSSSSSSTSSRASRTTARRRPSRRRSDGARRL